MIQRKLDEVDFPDLQGLLAAEVREGRTIEYKSELSTSDTSKGKMLAAVCSFANTVGGDLIYGVRAKDGVPQELCGLRVDNIDQESLRIEQVIRSGIEPAVQFRLKFVSGPNDLSFLVVRIPRSWNAPHRVKQSATFYGRHSSGKYPMDVTELRTAFLDAEGLAQRANNFRRERVQKLKNNIDLPVPLERGGMLVLHLIPLVALDGVSRVDLSSLNHDPSLLAPIAASGWDRRLNLDGLVVFTGNRGGNKIGYTQLFRSGIIEAVHALSSSDNSGPYIASVADERATISALARYLNFLSGSEIGPPMALLLSLIGVRSYRLAVHHNFRGQSHESLDRDDLLLPALEVEDYAADPATILQPALDMLWQAFDYERALNYDKKGKWAPPSG